MEFLLRLLLLVILSPFIFAGCFVVTGICGLFIHPLIDFVWSLGFRF